MTHYGPTSAISSCSFLSCKAGYSGGSFYHDSSDPNNYVTISDSLFALNTAETRTERNRGGGEFEDYRQEKYTSKYLFSFFTGNKAPEGNGNDISIQ